MSILGNSASSYIAQNSVPQWRGSKPSRFNGGRKHDNHPSDQLDHLLLGNDSSQAKILGPSKRRIVYGQTINSNIQPKPHLRTFENSNKSNIVMSAQQIPKLIKIPRSEEQLANISPIFRANQIGQSRMKKLQSGALQSGIYRNFYKSQFREASMLSK